MVLVTGPTGSGKTNTLYSSISRINKTDTNIMTAEDPVEFNMPGVNQVQMQENIGLNFAAALRAFLRQDPNIILVGEIRDFETAEIAIKAALTGHLVLSTLHTNDAPSTINRLMNMGIEPFLVATSVNLICAQRLVRRVCAKCKEPDPLPPPALIKIGFTPEEAAEVTPMKGRGCEICKNTGYKGRVGLYEVMEMTEAVRELDARRGVLTRAAAQGDRRRDAHAQAKRPAEDPRRRHVDRGSRAGDGALGKGQGNSWPRCLNCCERRLSSTARICTSPRRRRRRCGSTASCSGSSCPS